MRISVGSGRVEPAASDLPFFYPIASGGACERHPGCSQPKPVATGLLPAQLIGQPRRGIELDLTAQHRAHGQVVGRLLDVVHAQDVHARIDAVPDRRQRAGEPFPRARGR